MAWKVSSFDTRLSDRKKPSGSENSWISDRNSASLSRAGMSAARAGDRRRKWPREGRDECQCGQRETRSGHCLYWTLAGAGRPQPRVSFSMEPEAVHEPAAGTAAAAAGRPNERALLIERHGRDVRAEVAPDPVLVEVLLHVRQVHRGHRRAVIAHVLAHGPQGLRPREIADDGHEHVALLEVLQEPERLFGGEVVAADARAVGQQHQVAVHRHAVAPAAVLGVGRGGVVVDPHAVPVEVPVDVLDAAEVVLAERQAARLGQVVLDPLQVVLVHRLGAGDHVPERVGDLGDRALLRQAGRALLVEQQFDEVGPVVRQLEDRLVHQVHAQVAAAHVGDEHHLRLEGGDVGEVLLGPDAEVHAALPGAGQQLRNDPLQIDLVRYQVVRRGTARWARTTPGSNARTPRLVSRSGSVSARPAAVAANSLVDGETATTARKAVNPRVATIRRPCITPPSVAAVPYRTFRTRSNACRSACIVSGDPVNRLSGNFDAYEIISA